jgi:hypothetical protein
VSSPACRLPLQRLISPNFLSTPGGTTSSDTPFTNLWCATAAARRAGF